MFGYVVPNKSMLKAEDYEIFKSYYCGLCKSIKKENGFFQRFSLNYDIVFLTILLSSIFDKNITIIQENCIAHPLKKRSLIQEDDILLYSANMGSILSYLNTKDDLKDELSLKSFLGNFLLKSGGKKGKLKYENKYYSINNLLKELNTLEKNKCKRIDEVADIFGKIMQEIIDYNRIENESTKRILNWFSYNLGRWIYILDAYDDLEKDFLKGNYNPIILSSNSEFKSLEEIKDYKKNMRHEVEKSLTHSLANIGSSFELLSIKKNKNLLENIIYIGMKEEMENVLRGRENYEKSI